MTISNLSGIIAIDKQGERVREGEKRDAKELVTGAYVHVLRREVVSKCSFKTEDPGYTEWQSRMQEALELLRIQITADLEKEATRMSWEELEPEYVLTPEARDKYWDVEVILDLPPSAFDP